MISRVWRREKREEMHNNNTYIHIYVQERKKMEREQLQWTGGERGFQICAKFFYGV